MRQHLILGPPGTGKTTSLLNVVDQKLQEGIEPNEIAFMSFTRKAAHEARDRAIDRFSLRRSDFPWFSTLHSAAFRRAGLSHNDVMQDHDWRQVSANARIPMSGFHGSAEDGEIPGGALEGDQFYFYYCLAHAKNEDPIRLLRRAETEDMRGAGRQPKFRQWIRSLQEYQKETGLLDYTGMLDEGLKRGPVPGVKVAIIDEAQDLSKIQWKLVWEMFKEVDEIYFAGDDDQAIYRWSGADIDQFLSLKGERRVLEKSWRLPNEVWEYAQKFTRRISRRYEKEWGPSGRSGRCKADTWGMQNKSFLHALDEGEWMILVRNTYFMEEIIPYLRNRGLPYTRKGKPSVDPRVLSVIRSWETLRKGGYIPLEQAHLLYAQLWGSRDVVRGYKDLGDAEPFLNMDTLRSKHGLKISPELPWFEALSRISDNDKSYIRALRRRNESLTKKPRINVTTIHAVKGGEADNVLLFDSMSRRTMLSLKSRDARRRDDEHRVFYVGATRAKKNLHIVHGSNDNHYQFPAIKEK